VVVVDRRRLSEAKHGKAGAACYGPLWGGVSNADKPNPVMETAESVWIYFPVLGIVCLPAEKALAFHLFSPLFGKNWGYR
jgi:hypothetical protein